MTTKKPPANLGLPKPPEMTAEEARKIALEGELIRSELRSRIKKMWRIPPAQQQARSS